MQKLEQLDRKRLLDLASAAVEADGHPRFLDPRWKRGPDAQLAGSGRGLRDPHEVASCAAVSDDAVRDTLCGQRPGSAIAPPVTTRASSGRGIRAARDQPRDLGAGAAGADPRRASVRGGPHGIIVRGWVSALMLPQVASEMGWSAEQMLEAVCRKAGLP